MFAEIMLFLLAGAAAGVFAGLVPGLHPNNFFAILISILPLFAALPIPCVLAFVVSLSVSNTFVDFIPSIFFGAPDEETALSVLPGHKMLLEGRGYDALYLATMGGMITILLTIATLPLLFLAIPPAYETIRPFIAILLVAVIVWMIWSERGSRKLIGLFVFLAAGLFGVISLNAAPSDMALFPALTGMFAISTLITSVFAKAHIPKQKKSDSVEAEWLKGGVAGWLAGMLAGLLPGLGSSQSGAVVSQFLRAKTREFMIALGGINTSNIFFTFIAFHVLGKTRSGAAAFISQVAGSFTAADIMIIVIAGLFTCFLSVIITLRMGAYLMNRMPSWNYSLLNKAVLISLVLLVAFFAGPLGLLIAVAGTFLGIIAIKAGVKRTHMMGFLLFPTILYFSGLESLVLGFLF